MLARTPAATFFLFLLATILALLPGCKRAKTDNAFTDLTNTGKNLYDRGDAEKALPYFENAAKLQPTHPDALLNLANAHLLANLPAPALEAANAVLQLDPDSAAAHFVAASALLRLGRSADAIPHLQQAKEIDRTVNAVSFQLARAWQQNGNFQEAAQEFEELLQFDPEHPAAHYNFSQVLLRLGRNDEAAQQIETHQKLTAAKPATAGGDAVFERCQYTQIRLPFKLEQPDPKGIAITFADATAAVFGAESRFHGPMGVIDLQHDGHQSIFVKSTNEFRLLLNSNGVFRLAPAALPLIPEATYHECLVGDLNNDRFEDIVVLGDKGSHVVKLDTNAAMTDLSKFSRLAGFPAQAGALVDLDFTAKLDLLILSATNQGLTLKVLRNLGNPYFIDHTNAGVPPDLASVRQVVIEDWNHDDLQDVLLTRTAQPPLLLIKQRGGGLAPTNLTAKWPVAVSAAAGDLNNDLRLDTVLAGEGRLTVLFSGSPQPVAIGLGNWSASNVRLLDYDNDGWLDILCLGPGLRTWRNRGAAGFIETTRQLGLDRVPAGQVQHLVAADFDGDGDTDLVVAREAGLRFLRNDGGNANAQLKLHLIGNKSNASGLGTRLEVAAGGLRLVRRITHLPVEIGVGRHRQVDSVVAHWFDVNLNYADLKTDPRNPMPIEELTLPTGSCPYFYAWDGNKFRFITDILGAAPVGLRISDQRFVEADAREYVWIGSENMLPPKDNQYLLAITSELREVIYLDQTQLVAVDHPEGTEVHTTGKMVPGRPFPPHEVVTLHARRPLLAAFGNDAADVTSLLLEADQKLLSPPLLRIPQLRGLAEPHTITIDFGPLPVDRPLVLALSGWLRFGGGMVNVGASHNPDLPFPFPVLEYETPTGDWKQVDVVVGVPAGKTKSIIVDLAGKLPSGSRRLRLRAAFELHWDRIALFERGDNSQTVITRLSPASAELRWHGFGDYEPLSWQFPLTPRYDQPSPTAKWTIQPTGWCTRYGEIRELVADTDNAFALVNGGDEVLLKFPVSALPPRRAARRDFFLFSTGWEKDSDFHCELGWQVDPLPWQGMDDQQYGRQSRPAFPQADALMAKYRTRWVGPYTFTRSSSKPSPQAIP